MPSRTTVHQKQRVEALPEQSHATRRPTARRRATAGNTEGLRIAANDYIVSHYPIGFLGGIPRRLTLRDRDLWIVPIFLTSPGYGAVGEVGVVALEARTRQVVGSTPRSEVVAAGKRLRGAKHDELEAAFRRARAL